MTFYSFRNEGFSRELLRALAHHDMDDVNQLLKTREVELLLPMKESMSKAEYAQATKTEKRHALVFLNKYVLKPWADYGFASYDEEFILKLFGASQFNVEDCIVFVRDVYNHNDQMADDIDLRPVFTHLLKGDLMFRPLNMDTTTVVTKLLPVAGGPEFAADAILRLRSLMGEKHSPDQENFLWLMVKKMAQHQDVVKALAKRSPLPEFDQWLTEKLNPQNRHIIGVDQMLLLDGMGLKKTARKILSIKSGYFVRNELLAIEKHLDFKVTNEQIKTMLGKRITGPAKAALAYLLIKGKLDDLQQVIDAKVYNDTYAFAESFVDTVLGFRRDGIDYDPADIAQKMQFLLDEHDRCSSGRFQQKSNEPTVYNQLLKLPKEIINNSNFLKRQILSIDLGL